MKGILLALAGVLVLTPDALLLRLSGMDAAQMVAWRGLALGSVFLIAGLLTGQMRRAHTLVSIAGIAIVAAQTANASLFATGIALAPVMVVLLTVATVPIWSALLSRAIYGEKTRRATWITILCVLIGVGIAISGKGDVSLDPRAALGALAGFGVAGALALNFTLLRHNPQVPILPAVGLGALVAGVGALALAGPERLVDGTIWPIATASFAVLPISFYLLSVAPRHTSAANVSLFLLLETVLGPLWVWMALGESPTPRMLAGGAVVLTSLATYLWHQARSRR